LIPAIVVALKALPTDLNHLNGVLDAVAEYGAHAASRALSAVSYL
jgi:hypothetical protein